MGIRSVAIYSDADRHALHVKRADEAYSIGAEPLAGYLNPRKLVNLAVETGCDALHPGYGFLSETPSSRKSAQSVASSSSALPPTSFAAWATRLKRAAP